RRDHRKLDAKDRALAGLADEGQRSPVPLDDAVAEREAETRALTNRLGGKERLDDPISELLPGPRGPVLPGLRHASARPGRAGAMAAGVRRVSRRGGGALRSSSRALVIRLTTTWWSWCGSAHRTRRPSSRSSFTSMPSTRR